MKINLKQIFLPGFLFFITIFAYPQKKILSGIVKDINSDERVPFASVSFKNTKAGQLTDSSGSFSFFFNEWPSDTLLITCVGYQPFILTIDHHKDSLSIEIPMERGVFIDEVRVKVKINKGLFLWRKIVNKKADNDRYRFNNFSYELYNKLEIDLKNFKFDKLARFKPLKSVTDLITSNIDSTQEPPFLPVYLTEIISDYYYQKKPLKRREIIKAANTNGVKNESVLKLLGGMDQVVNVYNNFIPVFDKQFVSPISDNGDAYYNYKVADTQFISGRKYYHLVFVPRRRGENTFEGDCWVHDGTFAIQKMNLRLGKEANVNFLENLSLIQEYKLIDSAVWFLAKDKFVADISFAGKEMPGFIGRKTTTYKEIIVNDTSVVNELSNNKRLEETITLPSVEKDKQYWMVNRHEPLNKNENGIITMIDTLLNAPSFKRLTNTLNFLGTGYVNVGSQQLGPWYNWVTANSWEGLRVRFDVGTNSRFNKKVYLHGYLAYGFDDRKYKGKAEAYYLMNKHPRIFLFTSFQNDLDHGQSYYGEVTADNIFAVAIRKPNNPTKFIKLEEKRFELFRESNSGFTTHLNFSHKIYTPLKNLPLKDSFPVSTGNPLTTFETTLRLRFAYLEKFLENNLFRYSLGSPYPISEVYITRGISGVFKSSYNYTKISGSVSDYIKIPPYGNVYYNFFAGRTFGTLPYMFLDVHPGNDIYYYNKYAFNMMNRYEFISDKYYGAYIEHNIGNGIFRFIPKLKFRQFWNVRALWGSISESNKALNFKQDNPFQSLDGKTYMELGTGVDNILRVLRIDFVWRVFPKRLPKETTDRFAIFGSFRVSF